MPPDRTPNDDERMVHGPAVRVLDLHAGYRCRESGACCTAGWDIVAEGATVAAVRSSPRLTHLVDTGFGRSAGAVAPGGRWLARSADGACAFHDPRAQGSCGIHRELGHAHLPLACRQFPRVTLCDDRGTFVTLSHFCPTAAARLFDDRHTLAVRVGAEGFPSDGEYVGLDARGALPPLLRRDAAHSLASHDTWLRFVLATLDRAVAPEAALARVEAAAEELRTWTLAAGDLDAVTEAVAARHGGPTGVFDADVALEVSEAWAGLAGAAVPASLRRARRRRVRWTSRCAASWRAGGRALCRYLGAHAFANWAAYQGRDIRTEVRRLRLALEVVRVEVAHGAASCDDDATLLLEAVRRADGLLFHLVDSLALARALGRLDQQPLGPSIAAANEPTVGHEPADF